MLNNHVVSLELAKQLKEAGYPQESMFYWVGENLRTALWIDSQEEYSIVGPKKCYSAPLASELGEQLPMELRISVKDMELVLTGDNEGTYYLYYRDIDDIDNGGFNDTPFIRDKSLSNVFSKMWLYLKENNLLTPHDKERA